jgi:protein-S-isoprenylcysteine O-methyltransferase Ste14
MMQAAKDNTTVHWRARLQRLRVPLGFATAVLFIVFARPTRQTLWLGAPLLLAGVGLRAWASGHLRKNAELALSGPYAHTRNPLYFGSFVLTLGCAVCGGNWWLGLWLAGCFLLVYVPVMQAEAEHLRRLFGEAYEQWAARVPLFLPRLTPYRSGQRRSFELRQYLRHREYRALLGALLVLALLLLKAAGVWFRR